MRTHSRLSRVTVTALVVIAALLSAAATTGNAQAAVHWKLSARGHFAGPGPFFKDHSGFNGTTRVAISIKTAARQTISVYWMASCNDALYHGPLPPPAPKVYVGHYTSHGMGSKVPIRIGVKKAFNCLVEVNATPLGGQSINSLYISFWRD